MADLSSDIRDIVIRHINKIKDGMIQNMSAMGRTTSGASVASLLVFPDQMGVGASILGAPQWAVMQHGRGPGKVPSNFREIIKEWIQRKGISFSASNPGQSADQQLNSFAYIIARSIMKNGTRLYRDKGYNDIFDTLVEEEADKLSKEAMGLLSVKIDKILDKRKE